MRNTAPHIFAQILSSKQKAFLKAKAHALKAVVQIGKQGLTDLVAVEIEKSLKIHELIKVQIPGADNVQDKKEFLQQLIKKLPQRAHFVSNIGRTIILYLEKDPETAKIPLN